MLIKRENEVLDIEPFYIDENGNKVWNIPTDVEELRNAFMDTVRWVVGIKLQRDLGGISPDTASVMKAVVLVVKVLNAVGIKSVQNAINGLSEKERNIWDKLVELGDAGYADSNTLLMKIEKLNELLEWKENMIARLDAAKTLEDLIKIGEEIRL